MARKKSFRPAIKSAQTLEELRRGVESELNRLSTQLGSQDFFGDTSANTYRLTRLANPAAEHDAVNLKTMRNAIDEAIKGLYAKLYKPDLSRAYNYNDEEFTIIPGGFVINGLDMTKAFNFDTDIFGNTVDFTVLAGGIGETELAAGSVTTLKLTTQEINIGYSGNDMPVRLRIYDTSNNGIAWIGDDSANHGGDTDYVGAWFKRLLVGGDGTLGNAGMFADANGNVVAKSLWVYDAAGTTGWIGSRQITDPPYTTYYGGWFKELYVGGTWSEAAGPTNAPLYVDNSGDLFITDGSISITDGSGNEVKVNTTDGFKFIASDSDYANLNSDGLVFYDSATALKYGRYDSERMQVISGLGGIGVIGASIESFNGYGDVHVTNGAGLVTGWLVGGVTSASASMRFNWASSPDTPPAQYGALAADSGKDVQWYDHDSTSWRRLAYADELGTATAGGSDTQVQYNSSGVLSGESAFIYDDSTDTVTIGTSPYTYISPGAIQVTGTSANALEASAGGITGQYLIAANTTSGAVALRELSGDHSGSNTDYMYIYFYNNILKTRHYESPSWITRIIAPLDSGSSNTEIIYNSGGSALDSSSSFYYTSSICYAPAFQASSLFRLGSYAGVTGTFEDNNGNTVQVRGGIITDLTV